MSAPKKFRGYNFTVEDWLAVCEMHNHRCAMCGEEKPLCVDHIKPRAAGGTDDITNIQPLCKRCNSTKSSKYEGILYSINTGKEKPQRPKEVSVTVRFPADLEAEIRRIARVEMRSFNAQIIKMLEDAAKAGHDTGS